MSSVHDLNQPVVLDLGSGLTKGGYAGTPDPSVMIGTLVGHAKMPRVLPSTSSAPDMPASPASWRERYAQGGGAWGGDVFVGEKLRSLCGVLRLEYPMQRGSVRDWSGVEEVWRHVSTELLSVADGEHPFLVTENALNARSNRERMGEFFFESLNAPSLCVALPAVLALYASGRTSGLVIDVGDTLTTCVPIVHGHVAAHAIQRTELGGRDVSERLGALLRKSGAALLSSSSERQAARRVKERLCYVAQVARDEERRLLADGGASAVLPDGNRIRLGAERFRAPELLFRPQLVGSEQRGVSDSAAACVRAVDMAARAPLLRSVVLTGGSTLLRGFAPRVLADLRAARHVYDGAHGADGANGAGGALRVYAPRDRLSSAFTGGSMLASLSTTFRALAVSRAQYFEHGAAVLHSKCV